MTEDKARTKLCLPHEWNRTYETAGNYESGLGGDMTMNCIASECMMWSWDKYFDLNAGGSGVMQTSKVNGHCGLTK